MKPQEFKESQGKRLLRELISQGKRVFNMHDAILAADAEKIPHNQLKKILSSLAKHKRTLRLRRGHYLALELLPEHTAVHPFVIATHLIQPSAVSHWSALQHHGLTEQIPQLVTASTTRKVVTPSMREKSSSTRKRKHTWEINGIYYEYVTVQKNHFFGIEQIWVDEHFQVPITDKERTILDVFIYPKMFGGMGEALAILENSLTTINIQKLINYATQYNKKYIAKRLGWTLEYFGVPNTELQPLLEVPIDYYCRLNPSGPPTGPCDKRWMIQNNLINLEK